MSKFSPTDLITVSRAFDAMRHFLEVYWERGLKESDDIAVILGSLNRADNSDSLPLDRALWYEWLEAVEETRDCCIIEDTELR